MAELPEELRAEEGIAAAVAAMNRALATPWVRELIEARARSQQEDDDLLAEAYRAGQLSGTFSSETDQSIAEGYAETVFAIWLAKNPPRKPRSSPFDPVSEPEKYRWWRFDEERAQLDNISYIANFRRALAKNYSCGHRGEPPSGYQ